MITIYPRPESFIGKEVDGHRIDAVLGRGGMGIVFKAENLELSRTVALKIINPALAQDESFLRRFRAEARALAQIHHPNIVIVYAFRQFDAGFYISMEFVDGITLADHLEKHGALSWHETVHLGKQMLSAFHYAHSCGVIHRDIKPRNILLTPRKVVKITDFGLAKVLQEGKLTTDTTVTMTTGGTIHYMPPEQIKGLRNVDHRGDIFSLGMTMYEAISGTLPFDKNASGYTIQKMIVEQPFPDIRKRNSSIPRPLARIIMKALEKDPNKRFQSAAEMISAIEEFEMSSTLSVPVNGVSAPPAPPASTFTDRWKIYASLVGLLIVIGVFLGIFLPEGGGSDSRQPTLAEQLANRPERTPINSTEVAPFTPGAGQIPESTRVTTPEQSGDSLDIASPFRVVVPPARNPSFSSSFAGSSTGSIRVESTPPGAQIVLNDLIVGATPILLDNIRAGSFDIELQLPHYEPFITSGIVSPFEITQIYGELRPISGVLSLAFTPGSELYIDGKIFDTPVDGVFSDSLFAGSHEILIEHPGYGLWSRNITVAPGDSSHFDVDFTKKIRVIVTAFDTEDKGLYAEIYLDGRPSGRYTPTPFEVPVGEHTVSVHTEGYELTDPAEPQIFDSTTKGPLRYILKKIDP